MPQQDLVKKVVKTLEEIGIPYMVTGSIASSLQGEPRLTHDIDILIAVEKDAIKKLLEAFPPPDFYLSEEGIADAIKNRRMFNLIDSREGDKVDFWILTGEPFDQSRFSRRYTEDFIGSNIEVSAPEDTILAKLRWAKLSGGSKKQFIDALRVYEIQFGKLDFDYMERWVKQLDIGSLWEKLKGEAETG